VGVYHGDSLDMWQALFPEGLVVGVDNDPYSYWPPETKRIVSDQTNTDLPTQLGQFSPVYDLIVDDASHDGKLSMRTLELLWPMVAPGRWYVIEDWQAGYDIWDHGRSPSCPSMLDMAKDLLDFFKTSFGSYEGDLEEMIYRLGMIVMKKKQ
jgi:hypothetical protein